MVGEIFFWVVVYTVGWCLAMLFTSESAGERIALNDRLGISFMWPAFVIKAVVWLLAAGVLMSFTGIRKNVGRVPSIGVSPRKIAYGGVRRLVFGLDENNDVFKLKNLRG